MIIFFILIFMTTTKATEDTKYIDLLPEKEKQQFLESIARRILEEVESNPVQQKQLDVSKDELDVHDEFVKKILKEEEANLRKRNLNDTEDLSVNPLDGNREDIDLTKRSRTRRDNNGSFDENSDLKDDGVHSDVETQLIKDSSSKSAEKDIQIKSFDVKSKDNDPQLEPEANNNDGVHSDVETQLIKDSSSKSAEKDIQIKSFDVKSKDNDPQVEPEANNDDVQTISTDKVFEETEIPLTEHQDSVEKVKNNTFNLSDADETKISAAHTETNQSLLIDLDTKLTSKAEENINDENKKENDPIVGDNLSAEKHDSETKITTVQVKEALRNMTFLDIPVQVLRDDTVKNMDETNRDASTVPTTEEVTYATTEKQVIVTVETAMIKSELETKENVKRDVSDVSDKIKNHKNINDSGIEVSSFKTNNLNIGDSENIKTNTTDTKITNNSLFIDVETTQKSNIDVDSNTIQVKLNEHNLNKNTENVSPSIENIDIAAAAEDKTKENMQESVKSGFGNIKKDDISVEPNIYHIKTLNQRDTKYMESDFEVTTQKIEGLTPLIPLTATFNTKNKVKHTKAVDSNIIQVLRDIIERNKVKANGKFTGIKSNPIKIKEHKVYEIPKEKILVIDDITNKEQPYYYPIYNYSPNNAYYNAHNNLGPNQEDLGIKKINTQDQRISSFQTDYFFDDEGYNRNIKFGYSEDSEHKDHLKHPDVVKYPFKLMTDYEDPDISRTRDMKKELNEEQNIKHSIREIRLMMYSKKQFGYIPENRPEYPSIEVSASNETTTKPTLREQFEAILKREKDKRHKQISDDLDNYVNRKNHYSKTDETKQTNINIPLLNSIQKLFKNNYKIYVIDPSRLNPKKNKYIERKKEEKKTDYGKIKKILDMTNDVDAIPTLNKLLKMNITRSGVKDRDLDVFVDVLKDMIQTDSEGLEQYDWLGTTVNVQGASLKVLELTQLVLRKKYINPSDLELLKYIIYIFKQASVMSEYHEALAMNSRRGNHKKRKVINTKELIDKVWLYTQSDEPEKNLYRVTKKDLETFSNFIDELLNSLYELHTAIKEIASITKYNHQRWYKNLKELYLNRTRDRTLGVLLHMAANRVLELIESSAKKGLEKDYVRYIKKNDKEVGRTVNEFVFLMKILNEIENDE